MKGKGKKTPPNWKEEKRDKPLCASHIVDARDDDDDDFGKKHRAPAALGDGAFGRGGGRRWTTLGTTVDAVLSAMRKATTRCWKPSGRRTAR